MKTRKFGTGSAWIGALAAVLLLVPLVPGVVQAQTANGSIRGRVVDEAGEPIANANVVATNTETNLQRGMLTEESGFYNLSGLPPGPYELTVTQLSYQTVTQNVRVQTGQTLNVGVTLSTEAIEVAGIRAIIDRPRIIEATTPEVATNITEEQIENLPLINRNFLDFAALAPGVQRTPGGESITAGGLPAENINLFIDGVSFKNDVLRNGVVGQDASAGNPFPQNAVAEFRVITQNYKAEFQKAAGAVVTAATKSGTNEWVASGFYLGQNENFISKDAFQACEAPGQGAGCEEQDVDDVGRQQFGGSIGGPIIEDRLFFFGSYEGNFRDIPQNIQDVDEANLALLPPGPRSEIGSVEGTSTNQELRSNLFFGKLTYQPAEKHRFETSVNVRDEFEVRGFGGFNARSRAEDFNNDVITVAGKYQYASGRMLNDASLSWQRFHWFPIPLADQEVGRIYEGVLAIGGRSTEQDFEQDRLEFRNDLTYTLPEWGGQHVFKTGAYVARVNYDVTKFLDGNPQFFFREAEGFEFPFRARMGIGDPSITHDNTQYGLYVQDDWSPTERLILNLGLRWDVETNMLNEDWVTPDSVREDVAPLLTPEEEARYFTDGDDRDPFYGAIQPRIGFTYDLTGERTTTLFGGFGIFYDRIPFNFGLDERFRLKFPVFEFRFSEDGSPVDGLPAIMWDDRFLGGLDSDEAREQLQTVTGLPGGKPEAFLLENDTEPPMARQWTIGLRQAVGPVMLSANYTGVRSENQFTFVFGNRQPDGSLMETPRFRNVLLSTDEGETWYDALMLQLGKPFTLESGWGGQVSYTLAEAEANTFGLFTLDYFSPADFERFPANNDIRHTLTANWIVEIPWQVRFSGIAQFESAAPISAFVGNDPDGDGIGGDFPEGETRNSRRPDEGGFSEVNVRLEKGFTFANGQRIAVLAEVFNLFDTDNFSGFNQFFGNFDPATGTIDENPDFGEPVSLVRENPSRRLQLGVRYGF